MSETTAANAVRRADEVDLYCWQLQALDDLTKFVEAHGPSKKRPLPALTWTVGTTRTVSAEIWPYSSQPLQTVTAYADVLGVEIKSHELGNRIHHCVRGRIGRPWGTDQQPRTQIVITFTEWKDEQR